MDEAELPSEGMSKIEELKQKARDGVVKILVINEEVHTFDLSTGESLGCYPLAEFLGEEGAASVKAELKRREMLASPSRAMAQLSTMAAAAMKFGKPMPEADRQARRQRMGKPIKVSRRKPKDKPLDPPIPKRVLREIHKRKRRRPRG